MKLVHRLRAPALGALCSLLVLVPSCGTKAPPGELIMIVETDLSLPKDVDAVQISVLVRGDPRFDQVFDTLGSDGSFKIPASLGVIIKDGGDPSTPVTFRVTAFRAGVPKILREVVTTVPPDRIAALRMPVQWLCWDQVQVDDTGKALSSCPEGQTCVTGTCVDQTLDASTLETFDASKVFGGGTGKGDGECLDVGACFSGSLDAKVDLDACTITSASDVNVGIRVESAGICGPSGCFVPLDAESETGWKTSEEGTLALPVAVCDRIKSGKAAGVSIAATSDACKQKTTGLPTCGPWSSAGAVPPVPGSLTPVALVANQSHPVSVALAGGSVYWVNAGDAAMANGAIKRLSIAGGSTSTQLGNLPFPRDLALDRDAKGDAKAIYYTTAGAAGMPAAVAGLDLTTQPTSKAITFNIPGLLSPEGIALAGTSLFFTDFGGEGVYSLDLGSALTTIVGAPANGVPQNSPYRIVADGKTMFWVNEGKPGVPGSVMMADRIDPMPLPVAVDQGTPRNLALDLDANVAKAVYWTNFTSGEVMKATLSGTPVVVGAPETIASNLATPSGIALDATFVYWTNRGDGTVMKAPKAGGSPLTLAKGQPAPGAIVVDGDSVYWINEGSSTKADGALMKLSKSAPPL